jgi:hypothetical protein
MHFSKLSRRAVALASALTLAGSIGVGTVAAGGPPSLGFYVDDVRYRTVGTPTDFFGTGAPESSYDKIYNLGTGINVAESKPGDRDFNGGRWLVYTVTWADGVTPVQYTNDADILAAQDEGLLTINPEPVKAFFCNVAPVPGSKSAHLTPAGRRPRGAGPGPKLPRRTRLHSHALACTHEARKPPRSLASSPIIEPCHRSTS